MIRSSGGRSVLELLYPVAEVNRDLTWRPHRAGRGKLKATVDGRRVTARARRGRFVISTSVGDRVSVRSAYDRYGNRSSNALAFTAG